MKNFYLHLYVLFSVTLNQTIYAQGKFAQIEWEKDERSEKYLLQISKDKSFFNLIHEETTNKNSILLPLSEKINENLFGRVAGIGKHDIHGFFSKPFLIKIMMVEKPVTPLVQKIEEKEKLDVYIHENKPYVSNRINFSFHTENTGATSGTTFYKLNSGEWLKYTDTFHFLKEGRNIISYYTIDQLGNRERIQETEFYLDSTPPEISISPKNISNQGRFYYTGKNSYFQITAFDVGVGLKSIEYSFNSNGESTNSFQQLQGEKSISIPEYCSNKNSVLTVRATDNLENKSEKQFLFYHDTTPPEIFTDIPSGKEFFKLNSKIKITANDFRSGVKWIQFSLNNKPMEFYADSIELIDSGKQTIKIIAEDFSGNIAVKDISGIEVLNPKNLNTKIK
ncbi:MAG: hypothetical protein L6Q54_03095 [Leptospiraceae bacterium]|nr:hypothetical protein [Leptospiraceae bacterium]MCK6380223.1 hypothetical protein [Leptospiraceae bacterium]NUM41865.1 hypothetical protein [Leptospiraceae bacterium]